MTRRNFRTEHIRFERESWSRSLDFISAECVYCKNHLTELLNLSDDREGFIELSENYLNSLLQIETFIQLLRKEIATYDRSFVTNVSLQNEANSNSHMITTQLLHVQKNFQINWAELLVRLSAKT